MLKVIILGCPGSGKSRFAEKLHMKTELPLIHLDNIWWKQDRTHISRNEFDNILDSVIKSDNWIIDGDYSRTYEVRMKACDTIFFLDYSEEECMSGLKKRIGLVRPDIPWVEEALDPSLVSEVKKYKTQNRPTVIELLKKYDGKEIHIFYNRKETDAWINSICV